MRQYIRVCYITIYISNPYEIRYRYLHNFKSETLQYIILIVITFMSKQVMFPTTPKKICKLLEIRF